MEEKDTQDIFDDKVESFDFGKVIRVDGDTLVLNKYDYVSDARVEAIYLVTPLTKYGNIRDLKDLSSGEDVVVDFFMKDGQNIITAIISEEVSDDAAPSWAMFGGKKICAEKTIIDTGFQEIWTWFTKNMHDIVWPTGYALSDDGAPLEAFLDAQFGPKTNLPFCKIHADHAVEVTVTDGYIVTYIVEFKELSSVSTEALISFYDDKGDHFDVISQVGLPAPAEQKCRSACKEILKKIAERSISKRAQ